MTRVVVDGKFFALEDTRFNFRGVTYGTFARRADGALFPERDRIKLDLAAMQQHGFSVVRTYTTPTSDLLDLAADADLRVLAGTFYPDWRYLIGASRRQQHRVIADARRAVREAARRLAGHEHVLGLAVGNEIPADVVRWVGQRIVARAVGELAAVVRGEDPDVLLTYANYPTTEYLPLDSMDFLTFNVFLEDQPSFRRYLTRLHHLAGDRPLVLGEIGLDAGGTVDGERTQACALDWMLETSIERGVAGTCVFSWTDDWCIADTPVTGWHFGLTRADRTPRPALQVASRWNRRTVRDLDFRWPTVSVVVCAHNAEATLDECLRHTCALDYPDLEVVVIDDGSTDATREIVRRHPRAQLVTIPHGGLSVARNEGVRHARGDVVAYLDSDAFPSPEWPWYLVMAFDGRTVGGAGGPNVPPREAPASADRVACAPGGPVHVLLSDDRAEHVPGCNMAFWKSVIAEVGGFDPVYRTAGDDVDLCWKVLDRGWEIGFHPAALVWHHRRSGQWPYLRQQRGYGRSEALVEARHPSRFTRIGAVRWRGRIYDSFAPSVHRQRIYRGIYGVAAYQSIYHRPSHLLDVAHQLGVPVLTAAIATAPLGLVNPTWGFPATLAAVSMLVLFVIDACRARPGRRARALQLRFRAGVASMHLLQPLARWWGRALARRGARRDAPRPDALPASIESCRGVLAFEDDRDRGKFAADVAGHLHNGGVRVVAGTGWEDYDARLLGSQLIAADLVTTRYPEGCLQMRIRRRLRWVRVAMWSVAGIVTAVLGGAAFVIVVAIGVADIAWGMWRTGPSARRIVRAAVLDGVGSP